MWVRQRIAQIKSSEDCIALLVELGEEPTEAEHAREADDPSIEIPQLLDP